MSGVLAGFRIDGQNKLLRLHGDSGCAAVLADITAYLRRSDALRLAAYARSLRAIPSEAGPFPSPALRERLDAFFEGHLEESVHPATWADAFGFFPELTGWHAGFPFMPAARLDACRDVAWGFLLDLDAAELQIYDNRNARFHWRDMAVSQPAYCTLTLADARQLAEPERAALLALLLQHSYSDGIDPVLPLADFLSPPFPGPGPWQTRLHLHQGRARLLLERGALRARIRQVGELRLDDEHCSGVLHAAAEPAVLALTLAIHGPGATLGQLAQVAARRPSLDYAPTERGLPLLDLGLSPGSGLDVRPGPEFFDTVRARFLAAGMSIQGWRFLIKQEQAVLRSVLQFFPPSARILGEFARFINLLASALQSEPLCLARCRPALRGVERILDRTRGRPGPVREENARVFLRAIARARLSPEDEANLDHDAQDVSDFVYAQASVLKGATWRSLCRRSDAWHRALLITVDPAHDVRWPALLPCHATGAFLAVELDCGFLLAEEGLEQRHCIGTYVHACSSGASRVFSLRCSGRRVATLELQRHADGSWRMVQIRGKANSVVQDAEVLAAGEAVARAYTEAAQQAREQEARTREHQALQPGAYVPPSYLIHRQDHWTG